MLRGQETQQAVQERRPDAVQLRARRSPRLIALGVLFVVLGGLAAGALYSMGNDEESSVVMAHDVVRGQVLTEDDLAIITVPAGLGVERLDAADMSSLIGQTARTDLPAGSFPSARHLGTDPIPDGHSLVGLRLGPGRMPGTNLPPGTPVQLVSLAEEDTAVHDAVVAEAPILTDDGSGFVLDVVVSDDIAHAVARLSAAQLLAMIAVGEG